MASAGAPMNAVGFAWRSLVRQPARTSLGVLGVAAVGALLFDMLPALARPHRLDARSARSPRLRRARDLDDRAAALGPARTAGDGNSSAIGRLPDVRGALAIRFADAQFTGAGGAALMATFEGLAGDAPPPWTLLRGRNPSSDAEVVVSESAARALSVDVGSALPLLVRCRAADEAQPPLPVRVSGVAEFTFELSEEITVGGRLATLQRAVRRQRPGRGRPDPRRLCRRSRETAAGIRTVRPDLETATNEEMLGRIQESGFTYFRQISSVLTTVTVSFSSLLITVLLTVSVNQRLGEIAALRALGLSRRRMVADVLSESALIVGLGGLLSLPLGWALALALDDILRQMPGIPAQLHFFVYQTDALLLHLALLAVTALVAALYPMRVVATLPIAATLRAEVIG
jgi:putative ABC transport system permease protein